MPLLVAALAAGAPPELKNRHLAEGIAQFDAFDYAAALRSLTQALDRPSSKRDFARIHLYIGMIQHRYKLKADAQASFTKALDYDPKVKLPKSATRGAKDVFLKLRKAKLGDTGEGGELHADAKKKRRSVAGARRKSEIEPAADGVAQRTPPELAATSSIAREAVSAQASTLDEPRPNDLAASARTSPDGATATRAPADRTAADRTAADRTAADRTAAHRTAAHRTAADRSKSGASGEPGNARARGQDLWAVPPAGDSADANRSLKPPSDSVAIEPSRGPPLAGWVAVGVGVASAAVGVTFAVLSAKNGNDALDPSLTANGAKELHDRAVQQRTVSIVSFGACAAALGVAAVVFLTR